MAARVAGLVVRQLAGPACGTCSGKGYVPTRFGEVAACPECRPAAPPAPVATIPPAPDRRSTVRRYFDRNGHPARRHLLAVVKALRAVEELAELYLDEHDDDGGGRAEVAYPADVLRGVATASGFAAMCRESLLCAAEGFPLSGVSSLPLGELLRSLADDAEGLEAGDAVADEPALVAAG